MSLKKRKLSDDESSDEEEEEEETDEFEHESSQDEDINEEEPEEEDEDTNKVDDNMEIDLQPEVDPDYIHKHQTIFNKFKQSTESETIEQEKKKTKKRTQILNNIVLSHYHNQHCQEIENYHLCQLIQRT